jgi:hypothetical protein
MQKNSSGAWRLALLVKNRLPIVFPATFPVEFRGVDELQATPHGDRTPRHCRQRETGNLPCDTLTPIRLDWTHEKWGGDQLLRSGEPWDGNPPGH